MDLSITAVFPYPEIIILTTISIKKTFSSSGQEKMSWLEPEKIIPLLPGPAGNKAAAGAPGGPWYEASEEVTVTHGDLYSVL